MRLSDAEREALFEKLSRHAAEDRLEIDELERRVAVIAAAVTREDAAAALADLPPLAPVPAVGAPAEGPRSGSGWRRGRGHGHAAAPAPGWQPTDERFRDPGSGEVMRVWVDPGGARHYVADR